MQKSALPGVPHSGYGARKNCVLGQTDGHRTETATGLRGGQPLVKQDKVGKGSRLKGWVTLGEPLALRVRLGAVCVWRAEGRVWDGWPSRAGCAVRDWRCGPARKRRCPKGALSECLAGYDQLRTVTDRENPTV